MLTSGVSSGYSMYERRAVPDLGDRGRRRASDSPANEPVHSFAHIKLNEKPLLALSPEFESMSAWVKLDRFARNVDLHSRT